MESEWEKLLSKTEEISGFFESIVLIGGVAVYLHAMKQQKTGYAESSHDGDFVISLADYADMRDFAEVTSNKRLSKHQMIEGGLEFDVYVENVDKLAIPYAVIAANADTCPMEKTEVKIACLEHLLSLKMAAYSNRKALAKGRKDARDVIRIMFLSEGQMDASLLYGYLNDTNTTEIDNIMSQFPLFLEVAKGNSYEASKIKESATSNWEAIKKKLDDYACNPPAGHPGP